MNRAVGVIPARYHSSRLPGKAMAMIADKPMIQHVWERARRCVALEEVIIATDDERICDSAVDFGARVVMTRLDHVCGTDRVAEVAARLDADMIVNIQGDEPLLCPETIEQALAPLLADPSIPMGSLRRAFDDPDEAFDPNVTKVVVDQNDCALYFSRARIPFVRDPAQAPPTFYHHLGLYVYRRDFLLTFTRLQPGPLEQAERLEQLRALEHGYRIKVPLTEHPSIGVDTPEDLERVRRLFAVM